MSARKKADTPPAAGPGELLRQARIAQRKPLREVARVLNLPQEHIEALEKDDYGFAPREIYLRGYILGYAKLVKLPKRKITAALDRALHGGGAQAAEGEGEGDEAGATFATFVARLAVPAVVALLFGLLVSWWFFYEGRVQENFMRHLGGLQ